MISKSIPLFAFMIVLSNCGTVPINSNATGLATEGEHVTVSICDIANNPAQYMHVRTTVQVLFGRVLPHGFFISDYACPDANITVGFSDRFMRKGFDSLSGRITRERRDIGNEYFLIIASGSLVKSTSIAWHQPHLVFQVDKILEIRPGNLGWSSQSE